METKTLGVEDFLNKGRSLNFSGIKNSNIISKSEFDELSKTNAVFTKQTLEEYIYDVSKAMSADQPEMLEKAKQQISSLTGKILKQDNVYTHVYFMPKDKAEEFQSDFFSKAEIGDDPDTLEKAKSINSLKYSEAFKFKKTGKEIKDKVDTLLSMIEGKIESINTDMNACLKNISFAPNQMLDEWALEGCGDDCENLKRFSWECCSHDGGNYNTVSQMAEFGSSSKASSKEEAEHCRKYNHYLDKLLQCKKDREIAKTFVRNVDEAKSYDLTLEQLSNLNF